MKRVLVVVLAASSFLALGGCAGGYYEGRGGYVDAGYIGDGPGYAFGGPDEYYDGYYDGYYGPFNDGYWGDDGFFYYSDGGHRWHRDEGHHYWHGGRGGHPSAAMHGRQLTHIHGTGAPRMMGAHPGGGHGGGGQHRG